MVPCVDELIIGHQSAMWSVDGQLVNWTDVSALRVNIVRVIIKSPIKDPINIDK